MPKIDAATIRRIAVLADADPRSVRKVLAQQPVRGLAGHRVRRALRQAGLLPDPQAQTESANR